MQGGPSKFHAVRYQSVLGVLDHLPLDDCIRVLGPPLATVKEEPVEGSKGGGAEGAGPKRRSSKVQEVDEEDEVPLRPTRSTSQSPRRVPSANSSASPAPPPPPPIPEEEADDDEEEADDDEEEEDEDEKAQAEAPSKPVIKQWMEHVNATGGARRWIAELGKDAYDKLKLYATTDPNPAQSMDDMLRRADQYRTLRRMNKPL